MAEAAESGQERTEQPTEKRLREAREKGQVARSRELATAAVFLLSVAAMVGFGGSIAGAVADWLRASLQVPPAGMTDAGFLTDRFAVLLTSLLSLLSPVWLAALVGAVLAPIALGGLRFSSTSVMPDLKRLDPVAGLTRIYGRDGLADLIKSILRSLLIAGLAGTVIVISAPRFVALMRQPLESAAVDGFQLLVRVLVALGFGLLVLAAIDVPYQIWSHRKRLMMTRQEIRDELKETEGRPEVKARIRRLQQTMAQGRMMADVPRADVILVNPTHYAVALVYSGPQMRAPKVVAKGRDLIATAIRELAEQHGVPIVSSPPLARVLYRSVEIGQDIPVSLYSAVAQILGHVYQVRAWRREGGPMPQVPDVRVDEGTAGEDAGR